MALTGVHGQHGVLMNDHHSHTDTATLLSGHRWAGQDGDGHTLVTYSFSQAHSQYGADVAAFSATLTAFSAEDQAQVRQVLDGIEAVCNLRFVEVPDDGVQCGLIRYAYSQAPNQAGHTGFGFGPSSRPEAGDVWIGAAQTALEWVHMRPHLFLHETLHALGLKHPFDGAQQLAAEDNFMGNTVMSYSAIAGAPYGALSRYPVTPMPLDIAALQDLYGASSHNEGDTVYDLSGIDFQSGFSALWDGGGIDRLDASQLAHSVQLDLRQGQRSDVGAQVQAFGYQPAGLDFDVSRLDYDHTLALCADIENATGSQFGDLLIGNDLDNVLDGGAGDDLFVVAAGRKKIIGGAGRDTVEFAGERSAYSIEQTGSTVTVTHRSDARHVVEVAGVEQLKFYDTALAMRDASIPAYMPQALSGMVYRLYNAAFGRLPDEGGLVFHTQALHNGLALAQLSSNFLSSAEFQSRWQVRSDQDFVQLLYRNVLGREADPGGLASHSRALAEGATRADVLVCFSESAENVALVGVCTQAEFTC